MLFDQNQQKCRVFTFTTNSDVGSVLHSTLLEVELNKHLDLFNRDGVQITSIAVSHSSIYNSIEETRIYTLIFLM